MDKIVLTDEKQSHGGRKDAERAAIILWYHQNPRFHREKAARKLGVSRDFVQRVIRDVRANPIHMDSERDQMVEGVIQLLAEGIGQKALEELFSGHENADIKIDKAVDALLKLRKAQGKDAPERHLHGVKGNVHFVLGDADE